MLRSLIASAAFVAAVQATGQAIVVNSCKYNVYLANTPAMGGGFSTISQTLAPGGSYSQSYTQLTNGNGWSLKLSKIPNAYSSNILQYEYTFHNDGTIWYDLSEVNGNPWDGNWEITANNGCTPRQAAYRFATDDAYGMQACNSDASVTVTLCSGESGAGAPPSSPPPSSGWGTPSSLPIPSTPSLNLGNKGVNPVASAFPPVPAGDVVQPAPPAAEPSSTTLATAPSSAAAVPAPSSAAPSAPWDGPAVTVTNVHMETLTQYVTATAAPAKHHHHHPRHPHHRL